MEKPIRESHLTLGGIRDIAAMKLAAITGRVTKKDFIDLYFLLHRFSLSQMLEFYSEKYSDGSEFLVLKSLAYFADAETDEEPLMLKTGNWVKIKSTITSNLEDFLRNKK